MHARHHLLGAVWLDNVIVGAVAQGAKLFRLVANNLLLSVILGVVLIGTFYPIVARQRTSTLRISPEGRRSWA